MKSKKSIYLVVGLSLLVGLLHLLIGPDYHGKYETFIRGYLIDILLPMNLYLLLQVSFRKLMCISPELSDLKNFSILSSKLPVEIAMSMEFVLEITPSGINKAVGLQRLINDLQIENRNILAAGDGGNDVQLFSLASSSFVPDNAPDKIKSYADFIINRNKSGILSPMIYSLCELQ